MKKSEIQVLNRVYLAFLIIVLILGIVFSFKSGSQMYYLVNTNLGNQNTDAKSGIANWKIEVTIEY